MSTFVLYVHTSVNGRNLMEPISRGTATACLRAVYRDATRATAAGGTDSLAADLERYAIGIDATPEVIARVADVTAIADEVSSMAREIDFRGCSARVLHDVAYVIAPAPSHGSDD